jgi:uncharacterized membrane protein YedE/YeeE
MSSAADSLAQPQTWRPRSQKLGVFLILSVIVGGAIALGTFGWQQSVLLILGSLFGISLYHASFGFASSYRKLFVYGETKGIFAQILMLALATILFAPILIQGSLWGQEIRGAVAPVSVSGAVGAFLFGIGMQLGSGCACGTLYTIGGGSSIMVLTLLTFGLGAFGATLTDSVWSGLPKMEPIALVEKWGYLGSGIQLLVLLMIAGILWRYRKVTVAEMSPKFANSWIERSLYGPWSLVTGAIALAVLNGLTLVVSGRPWGVTSGFTLWAAKIARFLGWNPASSEFWSQGYWGEALNRSVFADVVSVTNFGVVLGAALAATLAGQLALKKPASGRAIVAALLGGLLMGYGARLAFGCNVGAYFSGIASTSLHGWLWIVFALLGTNIGLKLRSQFQLPL